MKIEINWNPSDIEELSKLKTDLDEFREIFIRIGTGKIDLSKDECLFIESLGTLIELTDLCDELIQMAEWAEKVMTTKINTPTQ